MPDINYPLFDEHGFFNGEIPDRCVRECTEPGVDASDSVNYWVDELGFNVPRELATAYLREFGAWDDLEVVDDRTLSVRALWVACGDIRENGEWIGLIH